MSSVKDEFVNTLFQYSSLVDFELLALTIANNKRGEHLGLGDEKQHVAQLFEQLGYTFSKRDCDVEHIMGEYFDLSYSQEKKYKIPDVMLIYIFKKLLRLKKYRSSLLFMSREGWKSLDKNVFKNIAVPFISLFFNSNLPTLSTLDTVFESLKDDPEIEAAEISNMFMQFHDCMFNIKTGVVEPFSYNIIPRIRYDLTLRNTRLQSTPPPRFKQFIQQATDGDEEYEAFMYQLLSYIVSPLNSGQYNGVFLYGEGANGKSVCLEIIQSFFRQVDISTKNLSALNSRFGLSGLDSKHLILSHESAKVSANSTALSALKNILTDRTVHIEEKGKDGRDAEVELKVVMATNERIHFDKESLNAMKRRLIILPFNNIVPEEKRNPNLLDELMEEKVEIIAFLMHLMRDLSENNCQFTFPLVVKEAQDVWFSDLNIGVTQRPEQEAKITNWLNQNLSFDDGKERIRRTELTEQIRKDVSDTISSHSVNKIMSEKFNCKTQQSNGERFWLGVTYKENSNVIRPFQKFKK